MKGVPGVDSFRSVDWWMHLLGNLPAMLFLMAFSVLVYTFARIYHKVLLAGVWFQARRFNALTVVLVLLNVVALIATFGDWAAELASQHSSLQAFVSMLTYAVTGVSAILAIMFLVYGALLYYQVQNIIRASSEDSYSAGTGAGVGAASHRGGGGGQNSHSNSNATHYAAISKEPSFSQQRGGGGGGAVSQTPGTRQASFSQGPRPIHSSSSYFGQTAGGHSMAAPLLMPHLASDAGTGFTPVRNNRAQGGMPQHWQRSNALGERADADPDMALLGGEPDSAGGADDGTSFDPSPQYINQANNALHQPGQQQQATATQHTSQQQQQRQSGFHGSNSVSGTPISSSMHLSLGNYASPNLPIRTGGNTATSDSIVAHSYVSSTSFSTTAGPGDASAAAGGAAKRNNGGALANPSTSTSIPSGYAASVSPEYSQLPNSSKARTQAHRAVILSPNGTTSLVNNNAAHTPLTPTDQLVGSMPFSVGSSGPNAGGGGAAATANANAPSSRARANPPAAVQTSRPPMPSVFPPRNRDDAASGEASEHSGEGQAHYGAPGTYQSLAESGGTYPDMSSSGAASGRKGSQLQQQLLSPSRSSDEYIRDRGGETTQQQQQQQQQQISQTTQRGLYGGGNGQDVVSRNSGGNITQPPQQPNPMTKIAIVRRAFFLLLRLSPCLRLHCFFVCLLSTSDSCASLFLCFSFFLLYPSLSLSLSLLYSLCVSRSLASVPHVSLRVSC